MSDLKLTPSLLAMLERIERHSGSLLMLTVTASGGRESGKLNKLRGAGYVVKCDHPSVTEGAWPAESLAITEAGRAALAKLRREASSLVPKAKHRTDVAAKKELASVRTEVRCRQESRLSSRRRSLHRLPRR
jgi:DNA-binding PadR family transcriptional regulator